MDLDDTKDPNTLIREEIIRMNADENLMGGSTDRMGILELLSATDEHGQTKHFYFLAKPSRYVEYKYNVAQMIPFELDDFGRVLEEGDGPLPSLAQQERMHKLAGIDPALIAENQKLIQSSIEELQKSLEGQ